MGFIAAGLAVAAIGAGVSAYGTAKNAAAAEDAANENAMNAEGLFLRHDDKLNKLIKAKENKLYNIGNIFDRFESTGLFGDTQTLKNLRTAQQDFSELAAGDFSGFESQLRKSLSDSLISATDSGSPIGTYAGLAADTQLAYRKEGINTAVAISEFLGNESQKLLGQEFGIMDQKFNTAYQMDRDRVNAVAGYNTAAAATEGVGTMATGNALQTIGSSVAGYGMMSAAQPTNVSTAQRAQVPGTGQPYPYSGGQVYNPSYTPAPPSGMPSTIMPGDPNYMDYGVDQYPQAPNPFSYGSGYTRPNYAPSNASGDQFPGMVLPPLTYTSALSHVGMKIATA